MRRVVKSSRRGRGRKRYRLCGQPYERLWARATVSPGAMPRSNGALLRRMAVICKLILGMPGFLLTKIAFARDAADDALGDVKPHREGPIIFNTNLVRTSSRSLDNGRTSVVAGCQQILGSCS